MGRLEPVGELLLVLLVPVGKLMLVLLVPVGRLGGFSVRSKDWTSAERIYGKPCECRGYPQASFAGVQTVHIGLKGVARARECASMGA